MINVIKNIGAYLNKFHECKNEELPLNFDYENNVGVYFEINNKSDYEYKDVYYMDIHFLSSKKNKLKLLELLETYEKNLSKNVIGNYRITPRDPKILDAKDDAYEHFILNLYINAY